MKYTSIVMQLLLAATLLMFSCKKTPTLSKPYTSYQAPFPEPYMKEELDHRLQTVIGALKANPRSARIFAEMSHRIGKPYWSKTLISEQGNRILCLVPLKKSGDSMFKAFSALQLDTGIHISLFRKDLFNRYRAAKEGPGVVKINHALNALNNYGFSSSVYDQKSLTLSELRLMSTLASTSPASIATNGLVTMATCYTWSTCIGDGFGNCEGPRTYFRQCVSDFVWFADYPYYSASGDFNGDGGYGIDQPDPAGGSNSSGNSNANMPPPKETVPDIQKYLSCFNGNQSGTVTFYADQPTAGTNEPVSILGGIGHAWIMIEQQLPGGAIVRRSFGFYPQKKVNPFGNKSSAAAIGNDAGHAFNVSWSATLPATQFNALLQSAQSYIHTYHLANYNCVNYIIDVAAGGGISLPRNKTNWIVGSGLNPGSFGEDLRQLPGSRTQKGNTPANAGFCQ
ncbi:hypothetical protein WJU16_03035 [Chitinophaga pollutisoli]|uniref:Uncharacterized protein n=1 Tax=Chitinophaga pollutisoli TaxID=3133966 RepID=A0ABZ2YR50_9BACT